MSSQRRPSWQVALALLGAPLIWALVAAGAYGLEEVACDAGWASDEVAGVAWLDVAVAAMAGLGLLVIGLGAVVLLRRRRVLEMADGPMRRGLQHTGWATAGIFSVALVLILVGVVTTAPCATGS